MVHAAPFQFDESAYRHDVKTLASDKFEGRGPLSEGEKLTIDYLAKSFRDIGLKPAFGNSFVQNVPMAEITADQNMQLKVGDLTFANGSDFTARTEQVVPQVKLDNSDVVFVGYGINAPEYGWNDYAGVDVKGKTVIVLVNDPGFATQDPKVFKGNAMTYYGRWTYKYEEAAREGAKAVFIVHETAPAAYGWNVVESSNTNKKYTLVDANKNLSHVGVMGWIQHSVAQQIFKAAGLDYDQVKLTAIKKGFKAIPLHLTANLTINNSIELATSHNVAGLLPGTEHPDEWLVMHAHWDHLGKAMVDGKEAIYHGAVDNASGVAGVLQLARYFKSLKGKDAPKRSILFADFTAEENGLLGAQYFAEHPPVPTKQLVALLNIDGMNVGKPTNYVLQYGDGVSALEKYLSDAAKAQGRVVKPDPRPQNGLMFRSDHFALAKEGVPGLLFLSLGDTDPDYIKHKYHQPADRYDPHWDLGGVSQDLTLMSDILDKLANNRDWPKWLEESDFKKRRAQDGR
ncbi:M28 family metallopeptidase [Shewanella sp. A32]|uniref:M28 family metallopeptidase n=1 Tax=Shewanella sp. A32 TaxID=3031327 RepID=UPI0023B8EE7E|nr:M28 family metallopeptidase [Shewanella sp. A32]MDF0533639.1 M28 family metallopeptidase [Shewanella sp. A32]